MSHSIASFQSGCLQLDLYPDSRGYVLFNMSKQSLDGSTPNPPISIEKLTCEYLVDVLEITVNAAKWITANCEDIAYEGRHLYYKFREVPNETVLVEAEPINRNE